MTPKKLTLKELRIKSFITTVNGQELKGGDPGNAGINLSTIIDPTSISSQNNMNQQAQ